MIKITIKTKSLTDDEQLNLAHMGYKRSNSDSKFFQEFTNDEQVKLEHMGYKRSNSDSKFFQEFEEVDEAINSVKWIVSDFKALAFDFVVS